MVIELATGIVLGAGIGYGIDVLAGTLPVFLVIFSLFGFAAGIRTMLGTARELAEKNAATAAKDKTAKDREA
jgi:ATP synthase protein I